jgi:hypothetical protein
VKDCVICGKPLGSGQRVMTTCLTPGTDIIDVHQECLDRFRVNQAFRSLIASIGGTDTHLYNRMLCDALRSCQVREALKSAIDQSFHIYDEAVRSDRFQAFLGKWADKTITWNEDFGKTFKYRDHRGSLASSMATARDFRSKQELIAYLQHSLDVYGGTYDLRTITIEKYGDGIDPRTSWDTHIVTLPGFGVLGFTDRAVVDTETD